MHHGQLHMHVVGLRSLVTPWLGPLCRVCRRAKPWLTSAGGNGAAEIKNGSFKPGTWRTSWSRRPQLFTISLLSKEAMGTQSRAALVDVDMELHVASHRKFLLKLSSAQKEQVVGQLGLRDMAVLKTWADTKVWD